LDHKLKQVNKLIHYFDGLWLMQFKLLFV